MRILTVVAGLAVAALPLAAQQKPAKADSMKMKMGDHMADPDMAVKGGGSLPAGWAARADRAAPLTNARIVTMGDGLHFTLGPAVIAYRATDDAKGPFHTLATFTQTRAPMHPESYGLFIGGQNLDAAGQQYTYFLVRGDGKFLIKRRSGDSTSTIKDWTESPAVTKADAAGKATNMLEIDNKTDPSALKFKVNGQEVYSMPAGADARGIVGLRVNHNLDVHVAGFALHQ